MKNKLHLILLLCLCLLLSGCADAGERAWQSGQKALAEENYAEALEAFGKAGSFQDSDRLRRYAEAALAFENAEYEKAVSLFQSLGDYKDSSLMIAYCHARELESGGSEAFRAGNVDLGIRSTAEASGVYAELALFRDSGERAESCREALYTRANDYMNEDRFEAAAMVFASLGDWQESRELQAYCSACAREKQEDYTEAAALFTGIAGFRDSADRADAALAMAYTKAVSLKESGSYRDAADAFSALGSYRDAQDQRDGVALMMISDLIAEGSFSEVLNQLSLLEDSGLLHAEDPSAHSSLISFLDSFMNSWMNAHAGTLNAFFSCGLLEPYVEAGGELDSRIRASLTDETGPQNYSFVYYGSEVSDILPVSDGFYAARVHGTGSVYTPAGLQDCEETLQVLVNTGGVRSVAAAVQVIGAAEEAS